MMSHRDKKSQMTDCQKNYLIEYLKKNSDLQSGKFSNNFTFKDAERKWTEISLILNSMPGASRDWKNWRKTWQDLKSRTKVKLSNKKRHARGTGGGPPIEGELTKIEEDIIDIVKVVSIEGHKETAESAVDFNFDKSYGEEHQNEFFIVEELSSEQNYAKAPEIYEKIPSVEKAIPKKKKSSTLRHTIDAVNDFKVGMDAKISMKNKYCREKIQLLERIASFKERKAIAAEITASANERIATALETIAESIL